MSDNRSIPTTYRTSVQPHMQGANPTKPGGKVPTTPSQNPTSQHPITVVLASDHVVVRIGVRNLLNRTPDIVVVGEASNGIEAIQLVNELSPDILLLLDMELPVLDGWEIVRRLRKANSPVKVVVLSYFQEEPKILLMFDRDRGAPPIKDDLPGDIFEAIRSLAS